MWVAAGYRWLIADCRSAAVTSTAFGIAHGEADAAVTALMVALTSDTDKRLAVSERYRPDPPQAQTPLLLSTSGRPTIGELTPAPAEQQVSSP
jgi:hypothetical protein